MGTQDVAVIDCGMAYRSKKRRRQPRTSEPKPAPGDLAAVQAFVNTVTPERGDLLAGPRQLGGWMVRHGLLDAGVEPGEDDWRRALAVRAGLRASAHATTVGKPADAEAIDRLVRAAGAASSGLRYDDAGPAGFASAATGVGDALGMLLAAVAAARLAGQWELFKLCARKGCRRAFYDASQSRTGRWCNVRCGDRVRAAAYRRGGRFYRPGR